MALSDAVDPLAPVVDLLVDLMPDGELHRKRIARIVAGLGLNSARARVLRDYLRENRDTLTFTRSDGPQARMQLLDALAGSFPNDVRRAHCVRCGRPGRLIRRMEDQRCCGTCYARESVKLCVRWAEPTVVVDDLDGTTSIRLTG